MTNPFGEPIDEARYSAYIEGGPDPGWQVRRFHLIEAISEPYLLSLDLIARTDLHAIDLSGLLGADLELVIERDTVGRSVFGLVHRVDTLWSNDDELAVRLEVVPACRYLEQHIDTRIFQDLTAPEILEEVLGKALGQYGRTVDVSRLREEYVVRDYCVQYAESDLDFASRIMEEEGMSYVFLPEQEDGKPTGVELMVLTDQGPGGPNADFEDIEGVFDDAVSIIADRPDTADEESIQAFEWSRREQPNKVTIRRFNWKRPSTSGLPESQLSVESRRGRTREVYIPDDRRRVSDARSDEGYEGTSVDEDEQPATRRRFEMFAHERTRGHGTSNLVCTRAGGLFVLAEHADATLAGRQMLITRAELRGHAPEIERDTTTHEARFGAEFDCIPADVAFRPALVTRRPKIHGPQTAIVTGPPGEEIHTDRHGRIKVRFHWDRLSPLDDTSSCWIRVAQSLAGPGWGSWQLPRVGMEVLVEFLDGNPDRPVVTGSLYNGENRPPGDLPGDKARSTLKSQTTPGGGGSNELRFDDGAGSEEVFFHAQKDHNEVIENDHTRHVVADESISVGGDRSLSVTGDQAVSITGNQVVVVDGGGDGSPHYSVTVNDDYALSAAKTVHVKAEEKLTLQVRTTSIELTPDQIVLQAGESGSRIVLNVEALMESKPKGYVFLDRGGNVEVTAKNEASLSLSSVAKLESKVGATALLTGSAKLKAADGGANLLLNADAMMEGNVVKLTSAGAVLEMTTAAQLTSVDSVSIGGPTVTCIGESTTIAGATVDVLGSVLTTVKGAAVKIN